MRTEDYHGDEQEMEQDYMANKEQWADERADDDWGMEE